jgi:hypothetical protein
VDSVWEQEKLEARKILENAAESHTSGAPEKSGAHFSRQKPSSRCVSTGSTTRESILPDDRSTSRTQQWRYAEEAAPRCTVVTGLIDLCTGGEGGKTPMRKLIPISDRVLSITDQE